jgi:transposase
MFTSSAKKITDYARFFLESSNSTHRQYEALRAYFVEGLSNKQGAEHFGYTEGSFRVLVHQFRQNPYRQFFLPPAKGPHKAPKRDKTREQVIALRKQNLSIYDISRTLSTEGQKISPVSISVILKEEGFTRLPRRRDDERPPGPRP